VSAQQPKNWSDGCAVRCGFDTDRLQQQLRRYHDSMPDQLRMRRHDAWRIKRGFQPYVSVHPYPFS